MDRAVRVCLPGSRVVPTMQRVAITGSSGYLGRLLIGHLREQIPQVRILGLDVREPDQTAPDRFVQLDVRSPELAGAIGSFQPDTVIHGAFVLEPIHSRRKTEEINIGGSRNVLRAVGQVCPERFMFISSATVYGAWPDNPVPMVETQPLRPRTEFQYSANKAELERLVAEFADEHQAIAVSWVRPAIIGGPNMDNYMKRTILESPLLFRIDGADTPLQFVHEEDVVRAIYTILARGGRGAYNVGPPSWTHLSEVAEVLGRRTFSAPFWLLRIVAWLTWIVRYNEAPVGFLYFVRYPWVVESARLRTEFGFGFRFSSTETWRETLQDAR